MKVLNQQKNQMECGKIRTLEEQVLHNAGNVATSDNDEQALEAVEEAHHHELPLRELRYIVFDSTEQKRHQGEETKSSGLEESEKFPRGGRPPLEVGV